MEEEIKKLVQGIIHEHEAKEFAKHEQLRDEIHQALMAARDSAPSSFSRLFQVLNDKMDKMNEDMTAMNRRMKPVVDIYDSADRMSRFVVWLAKFMASAGVVVTSLFIIKDWIKK